MGDMMRAVVVAGGTGGHIYPAIAIINKIKMMEPDSSFLYIVTTDRMEKDIIPKLGIEYVGIEMAGLNRKKIFDNFRVLGLYKRGVNRASEVIKKFNPDVVIGVGGYITAPVLYAAHKLKYKIVIHEQNSIPGLSNKFLARYADRIFVSLPGSVKYFNKDKTIYTGNPRSEEIIDTKIVSREKYGFVKNKKLVIIVMGSLGSVTMTKKIQELIPCFNDKKYQVLIITGKNYYDNYKDIKVNSNVKVLPFMDNLIGLMKDTDLIVSRAGASTIAEITAIGLPAILVPSPYVAHNHQYMNAKELEDNSACCIVSEEDFSKEVLVGKIDELLENDELYKKMHEASRKFGITDSATRIYKEIRKLVG